MCDIINNDILSYEIIHIYKYFHVGFFQVAMKLSLSKTMTLFKKSQNSFILLSLFSYTHTDFFFYSNCV